jgi:ketosteroid isomerase-like protein
MQFTAGQTFYYRLSAVIEAQDLTNLGALYHPDAVSLSLSTGQVLRGREAILDSFKQTFQVAGAISPSSVESLVEVEGAVCVEATLATRFAKIQTYDIYMLQAGMVKQHVGGLISPRPPVGQGPAQGLPQTRGGAFYHRYCQATEARDFATLESLYHPAMVSVSCSVNESLRGRDAIISLFKQAMQNGGYIKLKSIESFVENGEIIAVEAAQTTKLGAGSMGSIQFDTLTYGVFVLRAGQIRLHFGGGISPRGPELQQAIQRQMKQLYQVRTEQRRMIWDATHPRRYPW